MGKDAPIISKALRLVSFSLTLITIVILVTIGLSAWQVFEGFIASSDNLKMEQRVSSDGVDLVVGVNLPNKGIYPLELQIVGESSVDRRVVAKSVSGPYMIQPGEKKAVEFSLPIMKGSLSDPEFIRKLLFEDSSVTINVTTRIGFQPFAFVNFSSGFGNQGGSVFSNFSIRHEQTSRFNSTHSLMQLKVSYTNRSPIPFQGRISLNVVGTPTRTARGVYGATSFDVSVSNNEGIEHTVFLAIRNDAVGRGNYQVEVITRAGPISASRMASFGVN